MSRRLLHPFLLAAFPVLFLFARNADYLRPSQIVWPLVAVFAGTTVCFAVLRVLLRDGRRAALVTSAFVLLFMSYGHVWELLEGRRVFGFVLGRDLVLLPLWALLGVAALVLARRLERGLDDATRALNAMTAGLFVVAVVPAATGLVGQAGAANAVDAPRRTRTLAAASGPQRDIYYLIFDRYSRQDILREDFGYDNEPFLGELEKRGFFVARKSVSNYGRTSHSVASSMNMRYLHDMARNPGLDETSLQPLYRMFDNPRAVRFLRARGYGYANIGNWYEATASDPTADVNYRYDTRSEFSLVLARTTLLRTIARRAGTLIPHLDGRLVQHRQVKYGFDSLYEASRLPGPTFVFGHLLLPHGPYTFDRHGNYVAESVRSEREGYVEQLRYANRRILALVDHLLDRPPGQRPIIMLQADEGHLEAAAWRLVDPDYVRRKFPIFNAYYLPGKGDAGLYPSITPVNSFRVVFNAYFDAKLPLLPDEVFAYGGDDRPYAIHPVTHMLDGK